MPGNIFRSQLEKSIGTVDADGVRHDYVDLYKLASNVLVLGSRVAPVSLQTLSCHWTFVFVLLCWYVFVVNRPHRLS
jgi:hypothetical protein